MMMHKLKKIIPLKYYMANVTNQVRKGRYVRCHNLRSKLEFEAENEPGCMQLGVSSHCDLLHRHYRSTDQIARSGCSMPIFCVWRIVCIFSKVIPTILSNGALGHCPSIHSNSISKQQQMIQV